MILHRPSITFLLCVLSACWHATAAETRLDLKPSANRSFVDGVAGDGRGGWSDQGPENSLTKLKRGPFEFAGVGFDIIDGAKNGGKEVLTFDSSHGASALRVADIPAGKDAPLQGGTLYLLHTGCWVSGSGQVGSIEVFFDSGKSKKLPVLINRDVSDWSAPVDQENGAVAYRENNGTSQVGVYVSRFSLPQDLGRPVSVRLATDGGPVWIVLAATISDEDRPLPKPKNWKVEAGDEWKPVNPNEAVVQAGSALDFSGLFGPSVEIGSEGFATINDRGELVLEKNPEVPLRLLCESAGFMPGFSTPPEEIEKLADQIARAGYNVFRPHFLDAMLMLGSREELVFNPEKLDRWDRLSAALKKRGVYLFMDAMTSWAGYYPVVIGSKEGHALKLKSRLYYDEAARAHWKEGVKRLFEHVNPYTGIALKDEPQVLVVQLRNEAGLNTQTSFAFDPGIVEPFRAWLKKRYGTTEKLKEGWTKKEGDARVSYLKAGETIETVKFPNANGNGPDSRDVQRFFVDIERSTFEWMAQTIREIGVKVPLTDYNNGYSLEASLARDILPLLDNHAYHDHPKNLGSPGASMTANSAIGQGAGYFRALAGTRQWGAPFLVSEWGQPFWSPWRYEGGLTLSSLAALQGWQMITQHSKAVSIPGDKTIRTFQVSGDPPLKSAEYIAALLFRRGDVQTSPHRIEINITQPDWLDSFALQNALPSSVTRLSLLAGLGLHLSERPGAAPRAAYQADWTITPPVEGAQVINVGAERGGGAQVIKENNGETQRILTDTVTALRSKMILGPENRTDIGQGIFESDTGQILMNEKNLTLEVRTPRSEGVTLTKASPQVQLGSLEAKNLGGNATVFLGSLTESPIADSKRLLLIVATDALNSDMEFADEHRQKLLKPGKAPILVRVARIQCRLRHKRPETLKMWALDASGMRREEIPLVVKDGKVEMTLDTGKLTAGPTPYFEIAANEAGGL